MADALTGAQTDSGAEMTTDFLGRPLPISFKSQPALPQVGGGPASLAATASPSVAGSGVLAPPTSFGDVAKSIDRGPGMEQGGDGGPGGSSSEGSPGAAVGGQGSFPEFSVQSGPFGLSGNPFGITGTIGKEGGTQLGLTLGPGTISPSLRTGNPAVDSVLNLAGKEGLAQAGLPSSLTAGLLSALTHAPQVVGLISQALTSLGNPLSLAALAHAIASMAPGSVASLQHALELGLVENPETIAAVLSGAAQGPTYGGVQAPSGVLGQYGGLNMSPSFYAGFPQAPQMLGREDVPEGPPAAPTAEGPGISGAPPGGAIGQGNPTGLGEGVGPGGVSGPPGDTGPGVGPGDAAGDF